MKATLLVGDYLFVLEIFPVRLQRLFHTAVAALFSGRIFGSERRGGDILCSPANGRSRRTHTQARDRAARRRIQMKEGCSTYDTPVKRERLSDFIGEDRVRIRRREQTREIEREDSSRVCMSTPRQEGLAD